MMIFLITVSIYTVKARVFLISLSIPYTEDIQQETRAQNKVGNSKLWRLPLHYSQDRNNCGKEASKGTKNFMFIIWTTASIAEDKQLTVSVIIPWIYLR